MIIFALTKLTLLLSVLLTPSYIFWDLILIISPHFGGIFDHSLLGLFAPSQHIQSLSHTPHRL